MPIRWPRKESAIGGDVITTAQMSLHSKTLRSLRLKSGASVEPVVRITDRGADWCVRKTWRERLFGPAAPDWFALEHEAHAELVKTGHSRTVWRVSLGDGVVYAKLLDAGHWGDRIKGRILGSAAEREWRAAREAERRNIPAVRGLAVGVSDRKRRRAAFLSEGLEGAVVLPTAWERDVAPVPWRKRRAATVQLIDAVARLFAIAHERGFVHRDAHPDNILVRAAPGGVYEAVFADVHAAAAGRGPTSARRSIRAVAQLDHYFRRLATRTERLRFFRVYAAYRAMNDGGTFAGASKPDLLAAVSREEAAHAARLARRRDRRLRRNGKYFSTLGLGGGWRATVALKLARRHVFSEADVPDRTAAEWRELLQPAIGAITGGQSISEPSESKGIRIEARRPSGFLERLWWTLRGSPDLRAFLRCHRKRHRDQPGELLLGYAEHRSAVLVDATLLITPNRPGQDRHHNRNHQGF